MNASVRELFRELADVPETERVRVLAQREISADIRAEVESLLRHDSESGVSLTRRVSGAMQETLRSSNEPSRSSCGPYRLVQLLGSGGMGAVYLAERRDGEIEQKVAIKLLRADADRPAWRDRFLRERQLLAYLNHPAIARLLDAGHTDDGHPYLVMEYVRGVAVDEYAAPLDLRDKLKLFLRICDGVSHAHHQQIIHRDLKPSNILVDPSGQPKLLDFGIAKLLETTGDETRTVERLCTPNYASPEQLRGDLQTTATDVYSLGAVLYKLLTGWSPREPIPETAPAKPQMDHEDSIADPSRVNPKLPRDVDHIVRKALRYAPDQRYASVDAFADDVRAFLDSKPVQARCGDTWYQTRKFALRHRVALAAATTALAGLLLGLLMANQQRAIAQERFQQVRQLATNVLALDQEVGGLDGATKTKQQVAAISKVYLEAVGAQARKDHNLALEVGETYSLLARVQGISFNANPDQQAQAAESLRKADAFVGVSLRASPDNRKAVLSAAKISHHRMMFAQSNRQAEATGTHARRCAAYLNQLLGMGELSEVESETVAQVFNDISLVYKNLYQYAEAIHYARRSVEAARSLPKPQLRLGHGLSMLANLLRLTGDLEGALTAIREARLNLETARFPSDRVRRSSWALVLSREGLILGAASGISLNRPDEAIPLFQRTFDLLEEWTQEDPDDAWSRWLFATAGRCFGDMVRPGDPQRALAIYDHALLRLREVKDNVEARRGEAEVLAGSAYALRQLHRFEESRERVDAAFRLLSEVNDYPAESISPHDAVHEALLARADHLAETGEPEKAAEIFRDLLDKIQRSKPEPYTNLAHAVAFSRIFGSLAALHRRNGEGELGDEFAANRLQLWRDWYRRLPGNSLVRRQIALARVSLGPSGRAQRYGRTTELSIALSVPDAPPAPMSPVRNLAASFSSTSTPTPGRPLPYE